MDGGSARAAGDGAVNDHTGGGDSAVNDSAVNGSAGGTLATSTPMINADEGCPICTELFCEPLTLECGHSFCRLCILQTTRLSPDGRACPICRQTITIRNIAECATTVVIEQMARAAWGEEAYAARQAEHHAKIEDLTRQANTELPIFAMSPGARVGAPVALHFFEPRSAAACKDTVQDC